MQIRITILPGDVLEPAVGQEAPLGDAAASCRGRRNLGAKRRDEKHRGEQAGADDPSRHGSISRSAARTAESVRAGNYDQSYHRASLFEWPDQTHGLTAGRSTATA